MNKEIYIVVGMSIFAFLLGIQLKKKFSKKKVEAPKIHKSQRSKFAKQAQELSQEKQSKYPKIKSFFLWLQVVVLFLVIVFMIPALSRDILVAEGNYDLKLILRILIVISATYTLFVGLIKLLKKRKKS